MLLDKIFHHKSDAHPAPQGCGKTDAPLTLYFVPPERQPRIIPGTFERFPCGKTFCSRKSDGSYGIALCESCALSAGLIRLN